MPDGSLICSNCGKTILESLQIIEGTAKFYCRHCHYHEEIKASTAQVGKEGLTNFNNRANVSTRIV